MLTKRDARFPRLLREIFMHVNNDFVFDKESRQNESTKKDAEKQEVPDEKTVAKLIEKLSEKDE